MDNEMKVFTGNSNSALAEEICQYLKIPLGEATAGTFSDGEIMVQINENVRGKDIFVIQSFSNPVNKHIMELLIMIDAFKRASAYRITAVIPYFGYARQDRKVQPRVPITAKLVADLVTAAGTNRVLTIDLHVGQIQGFFNIPVDNLFATPVLLKYLKTKNLKDLVVVSPDAGGVERARAFAKKLKASLAIIDKRRGDVNVSEVMNIIGDVKDRDALLLDDMIDTAGTITQGAEAIRKAGAKRIFAASTHGVLSGSAINRLNESVIDEVILTNTYPLNDKSNTCKRITILSVAPLLGEAIRNTHNETSVSSLFI
ncbi:MAG TPA: phosphoribosylpyrophosphate synthetase [Nitrospiraceae bacterium]|nr:MAG: phosphoribosylpyrophosphate synthetase [Nitrospirae bacterium GWA2_42_11]OGW53266.1 MAG: phosphoribosylpyrophosphate synthetase [Nitrospirae bacterium RIFCSPLOWO2_02_42_7]OGW57769.1 MAG: phosphoribosylpyrophosphate synthetase [Nitrospirae bacterium RIFCSPHIGHO2_02_FULL_42_12]HBI24908.1 phosphoribosylpyrophosphate synthetase [Nitrospiraceae bacterium]